MDAFLVLLPAAVALIVYLAMDAKEHREREHQGQQDGRLKAVDHWSRQAYDPERMRERALAKESRFPVQCKQCGGYREVWSEDRVTWTLRPCRSCGAG